MKRNVKHLTLGAVLIALGILIPIVMPIKIVIGPASFTLASHVPVFLAMFISPMVAVFVAIGTAIGFLLSGMGPIIFARALSHVIFAAVGAWYLQKRPQTVCDFRQFVLFNGVIAVIHAFCEMVVVYGFFFGGSAGLSQFSIATIMLFIGAGGIVHSLLDFFIAYIIGERLSKRFDLPVFTAGRKAEAKHVAKVYS